MILTGGIRTYCAVGEQISKGELGGDDRIFELKIRQVLADRRGIPVHLAFCNQFTHSRGRECLCQRPNRLDRLFYIAIKQKYEQLV